MYWAASGALALLHLLRIAWTVLVALLYYPFVPNPMPLDASRSKTPQNLALVLSETSSDPTEEEVNAIMDSVVHAVAWCEAVGVTSLCVYDQHGMLCHYMCPVECRTHPALRNVKKARSPHRKAVTSLNSKGIYRF